MSVLKEIKNFEKELAVQAEKCDLLPGKKLNITQLQIMGYLFAHWKEETCQKDLENFLHMKKASITASLDSLELKGLVVREKSAKDGRKNIIRPAESESEKLRKYLKKTEELEYKALEGISEEEKEAFLKTLEKMRENLRKED